MVTVDRELERTAILMVSAIFFCFLIYKIVIVYSTDTVSSVRLHDMIYTFSSKKKVEKAMGGKKGCLLK